MMLVHREEWVQDVTPRDTSVAWICALPVEMTAARAMLDVIHNKLSQSPMDDNVYLLGEVSCHKCYNYLSSGWRLWSI